MEATRWNLCTLDNRAVEVWRIHANELDEQEEANAIPMRLLILSHHLSINGIPSTYTKTNCSLFEERPKRQSVIVFDIFDKMFEAEIPFWCQVDKVIWKFEDFYKREIITLFQHSLTLLFYYKYYEFHPLYFTSFLVFDEHPYDGNPFYFKPIPVLNNGLLGYRIVIHSDNTIFINTDFLIKYKAHILVSPFEYPFSITSVNGSEVVAIYPHRKQKIFNLKNEKYVVLTDYSTNFVKKKTTSRQRPKINEAACNFTEVDTFSLTETDILELLTNPTVTEEQNEPEISTIISDSPPSIVDILSEQVLNEEWADAILSTISGLRKFPSNPSKSLLQNTRIHSTLDHNLGYPNSFLNQLNIDLELCSDLVYQYRLSVPELTIIQNEKIKNVQANTLFEHWLSDSYQPISGPKEIRYILIAEDQVDETEMIIFTNSLVDSFSKYNLGTLVSFENQHVNKGKLEHIPDMITKYFESPSTVELRQTRTVFIVASSVSFEIPPSYTLFVKPSWIKDLSVEGIDTLAFELYTKIREMNPGPYGESELSDPSGLMRLTPAVCLFFGVTMRPAFAVNHTGRRRLHVCVNPANLIAVLTDSSVQTLKGITAQDPRRIAAYLTSAPQLIDGQNPTVSVLGERLLPELAEALKRSLVGTNAILLSIAPATYIQANLSENDGDAIIQAAEFQYDNADPRELPSARIIVVCPGLQAYTLSIYDGTRDQLIEIAREFSSMSWASVKPGLPKRTTSLPPHVSALIQCSSPPISALTPFECLPAACLDY